MRETRLNDGRSHCEDQQQAREIKPVLRSTIVQYGAAALLFIGVACSTWVGPAQAVPVKNPEKCKGAIPIKADDCGGWVECTNDGDFMCCVKNELGGKDCEQIEAFTKPKADVGGRIPGGKLQVAPGNPPPKRFSQFGKPGAGAAIRRRGVEGEGSGSAQPEQEGKATAPK